MDQREENLSLSKIAAALPQGFRFYHMGEVAQQALEQEFEKTSAIGVRIYGDVAAFMIIFFSSELDVSVYSELGNVLASRLVTELHSKNGMDVMISPPQLLTEGQLKHLLQNNPSNIRRTYAHYCENSIIPVETWILPASPEGVGYA